MFELIKEIYQLLTPNQRRQLYRLQLLVITMALFELIGISAIAPFMAVVSNPELLDNNHYFHTVYAWWGEGKPEGFLLLAGLAVLLTLSIAAITSMFTIWKLSKFATHVGVRIADRLYSYYLRKDWLFHAQGSSAQLTKQVSIESTRLTDQILIPLMHINARLVLVLFILAGIIIYDPAVAVTGVTVFSVFYYFIFKLVQKKLQSNGAIISDVMTDRFRLMNEGFGGIRDVLLLGKEEYFCNQFKESGDVFADARASNMIISILPRYFIELAAFGSIVSLVLFLLLFENDSLSGILPIISLYALAGFKLLPALQQIYANLSNIKGNMAAFQAIKEDLLLSECSLVEGFEPQITKEDSELLNLEKQIYLKNVIFAYPGKQPTLNGLFLRIKANSVVGIVGPSGSGKSTLIDIITGLITPDSGEMLIDDRLITLQNKRAWQNTIGFVSQNIFLSEGTISENVAFGVRPSQINKEQVMDALRLAQLETVVDEFKYGLETTVGERGVQLSGGQRQRIGIARALYHKASVLVFDEATSALDGVTEKNIMDSVHKLSGNKTIVMVAHRLKTVQKCDQIFFIDRGQIVDHGTYRELFERNDKFRQMAGHV